MKITNPLLILNDPHVGDEETALVKGSLITARVLDRPDAGPVRLQLGSRVIQAIMSRYVEPGSQIRLFVEQVSPRLVLNLVEGDLPLPGEVSEESPPPQGGSAPLSSTISNTAATVTDGGAIPRNAILARILDLPGFNSVRLQILPHPDGQTSAYESKEGVKLFPGQTFDARLIQTDSTTNLRPGQDLFFRVTQSSPNLVLQIDYSARPSDGGKVSLVHSAAQYLNAPQSVAETATEIQGFSMDKSQIPPEIQIRLEALQTLVNALSPDGSKPDTHFLDRVTVLLGLAGDRPELRDEIVRLIANLAKSEILKDQLNHPALKALAETSARLFEAIEQLHGLNREGIRQEQTLLVPFPLFWADAKSGGEIRLTWSGEKDSSDGEGAPFRVTLLLNLTRLGKIKADLELRGKTVRSVFWTETSRAQTALVQSFDRFENALSAWGLNVESMLARVYPAERRMPDSLAEEIIEGSSLVNVRV